MKAASIFVIILSLPAYLLLLAPAFSFMPVSIGLNSPIRRNNRHSTPTALFMSSSYQPPVPNYCSNCGSSDMTLRIPEGDERLRACCNQCGNVVYSNPKIVAACVVSVLGDNMKNNNVSILMGERAIEPRKGTWGIPQGYMEHGETSRQAAVREVYEETGVVLDPTNLHFRAIYNVPGSVQLVYEAVIDQSGDVDKLQSEIDKYNQQEGGESKHVALLTASEIQDKEICFPTVQWALDHCQSLREEAADRRSTGIQQMTKMYDASMNKWMQHEDEPALPAVGQQ